MNMNEFVGARSEESRETKAQELKAELEETRKAMAEADHCHSSRKPRAAHQSPALSCRSRGVTRRSRCRLLKPL